MNWIPLWNSHSSTYIIQFAVGIVFTVIYFFVFTFLIGRYDFKTPGREVEGEETKLYTKADYKEKQAAEKGGEQGGFSRMASDFLDALGGAENIAEVTNCATRLRVSVKDESLVQDAAVFKTAGAHGAVIKGKSVQVIVGLNVPTVREEFEKLL